MDSLILHTDSTAVIAPALKPHSFINLDKYLENAGDWLLTSGLQVILIVILLLIALKTCRILSRRLVALLTKYHDDREYIKRAETLAGVMRNTLKIFLFGIAFMMILREFSIDLGPIIAAAGVVGLAVGFGAQGLVKDVIAGFFILIEDQIRVGDVVEVSGKFGLVEKINLRMVVLRDWDGAVHYIRNGESGIVTNRTKDYSYYIADINVAYKENVDEVIKVIRQVGESLRRDFAHREYILEALEVMGVEKFAESAVIIRTRIKTLPGKQWRVGYEFNRQLKEAFDRRGIEIPFPHIMLYTGRDKTGKASGFPDKTE